MSFQRLTKNEGYKEFLMETETTSLKTSRYDCIEDNSMLMKECIDDFINEELNCSLPWTTRTNLQSGFKYCQTAEELVAFRNLSLSITSPDLRQKLINKGCFRPNCKQRTWMKNNQFIQSWQNKDNSTMVKLSIPSTSKVIQRKEIRLADFGTFIADVGSYLGLYLGASILSLTDMVHVCCKQLPRSVSDKSS